MVYADDMIIFSRASRKSIQAIADILKEFCGF